MCLCPARQLKQQLRSELVAGQWGGDTALTLPLFWRRSTVSPVFFTISGGIRGRAFTLSSSPSRSVEELETLPAGTKPRTPHHRSPGGERHRKKEALDDLSRKDERGSSSVRRTWNCFKTTLEKHFRDTGWSTPLRLGQTSGCCYLPKRYRDRPTPHFKGNTSDIRVQQLCENRGGRPVLPVPNKP